MKFFKTSIGISLVITFALLGLTTMAYAQNQQATLNQYVVDLQKNPNDNALRVKIIKHVQTMKQKPAVPEDAKKYMVRGKAAFKGAKEEKDFNDAAEEFKKALLVAPWLAEGYYNLGIVQDRAGQYAVAMESLKLYVIAAPNAPDVEKVKELIYEIEYRKEKAAKESSPKTIAVSKQDKFEDLLKKIDGRRYTWGQESDENHMKVIDVRGRVLVYGFIGYSQGSGTRGYHESGRIEIKGRETIMPITVLLQGERPVENTWIISEYGESITFRVRWSDGDVREYIYLWQR